MKPIFIGILSQEKIRQRVLAIARGSYKPKPNEPKVWFTSMKSLAEVLSDENRALLLSNKPISIANTSKTFNLSNAAERMTGTSSRCEGLRNPFSKI